MALAVYGADTAELERLATQMSQAAQRLNETRASLGAQLGRPLGWHGPDAERFGHLWQYEVSQKLAMASAALATAAGDVLRNAREQDHASGAAASGPTPCLSDEEIFSAIGIAGIIGGVADTFRHSPLTDYFGKIMSLLGLVDAGRSLGEGWQSGNGTGVFMGGVDLASAGMGLAPRAFGPLSLALGVFTTFVEATIPVQPEDYDGMRAAGARSAFGKNPEDLTEAQLRALDSRYEGPIGVAHMISDQMDNTADKVGKFFGKLFGQ